MDWDNFKEKAVAYGKKAANDFVESQQKRNEAIERQYDRYDRMSNDDLIRIGRAVKAGKKHLTEYERLGFIKVCRDRGIIH